MRRPNESRSESGLLVAMLVVALAAVLAMIPGAGHSTILVRDLWAPDGEVRVVAEANNTLYLGGSFSHVGPVSGPAVTLGLTTAVAQTPYPKVIGKVNAVEPDGSGGWYIGGKFNTVQGQLRVNLAHIDAAGQVTPWKAFADGEVLDIALSGGVVYVVGTFLAVGALGDTLGSVQRYGAAAMDAVTGTATHWDPDPDAFATEVEVGGGKVYLGGPFTTVYFSTSNQPRAGLAEFTAVVSGDTSSGALTGLFAGSNPSLTTISGLKLAGGNLFFGATYTTANDLHIYDVTAGSFLPYLVTLDGPVYDIALNQANGTFFLGGSFANVGGQPRTNLAALNLADGSVVPSWNVAADAPVRTLALAANGLLVGGDFSTLGGMPRRGLGIMDPVAPNVLAWDAACGGNVHAVVAQSTRAYVGGDFSIINSVPRSNLAAMDEITGALLAWNPTTNAMVEALMVSGSTVFIGGQFSNVSGTTRNRAAAVDAATGALTTFNPNVDPFGSTTVKTFATDGSTVYMGGVFETVRGVEHIDIAAVNATSGIPLTWDPQSNGPVNSITYVPGGIFSIPFLVVGGEFTFIGGQFRNYLATLDPSTGGSPSTLDSPNGPVYSVCVEALPPGYGGYNQVFMGGAFTSVAGQPRNHIASVAAFGLLTSWSPNASGSVYSIAKVGNTIFAGGAFASIGAQPRWGIAAIDASGMAALWDPQALTGNSPGVAYSVLESAGTVYAGGSFTSIAATPHSYFAGMGEIVTAVESAPVPDAPPIALRAAPNPFDRSTEIQFSLPTAGEARITVYDVTGRRVRKLHSGWLPPGRHTMSWDGREDSGKPVAAGVYFVGVTTRMGSLGSKIYRLK